MVRLSYLMQGHTGRYQGIFDNLNDAVKSMESTLQMCGDLYYDYKIECDVWVCANTEGIPYLEVEEPSDKARSEKYILK